MVPKEKIQEVIVPLPVSPKDRLAANKVNRSEKITTQGGW